MPPVRSLLTSLVLIALCFTGPLSLAQQQQDNVPENNQDGSQGASLINPETSPEQPAVVSLQGAVSAAESAPAIGEQSSDQQPQGNAPDETLEKWDLRAQWVMAIAAVILLLVGFGQLYLSHWGIKLLTDTLSETKNASEAAMIAAKATEKAAEATYIQATSNRAWITVTITNVFQSIETGQAEVVVEVTGKVVGETPARDITMQFGSELRGVNNLPALDEVALTSPIYHYGPCIHGQAVIKRFVIDRQRLSAICNTDSACFIRTRINYKTVHDDIIRTTDCVPFVYCTVSFTDIQITDENARAQKKIPFIMNLAASSTTLI